MSKIQNSDVKSAAELVSAGATAAQLINDTKIYVTANSLNKTLDAAITAGDFGGFAPSNGRVVSSVGQVVAHATSTKVQWNASPTFTQNITWSSANNRFIATAAGKYFVESIICPTASFAVGNQLYLELHKNGALYQRGQIIGPVTANFELGVAIHDVVDLAVNDYVEINAYFSRGGLNTTIIASASFNHFSIFRVA